MIPSITAVRMTAARHRAELPLLVLGPSLGTSATPLWSACAAGLADAFDVFAWDLPGHGHNRSVPEEPFTMAELAAGVLSLVDDVQTGRGLPGGPFFYAGASIGGAVGLQLMLDSPHRVVSAALLGTSASADGDCVEASAALAAFDVRPLLSRIAAPVLAVAGSDDVVTPPERLREIASGVRDGSYVELPGVAHLALAESPDEVARLLRAHFLGEPAEPVETDFARDVQQLATAYARGEASTRPGLDLRSRSLVTLTALVVAGDHEELAAQVRAALGDGLTGAEIREVVLQSALHCGVTQAEPASRIVASVVRDHAAPTD